MTEENGFKLEIIKTSLSLVSLVLQSRERFMGGSLGIPTKKKRNWAPFHGFSLMDLDVSEHLPVF